MNLGLVVMGGAILSNLLIQFSVDGLELCSLPAIYLGPNCGGGNEDNGDLLKGPMHPLLHAVPRPCSRPPPTHASAGDVDTHRQVWVGLLWGRCSVLLGPGAYKVLFVPSKSLFP